MALSPQQMMQRMVERIEPRTGKSFQQWVELARTTGIDKHKALTVHMKAQHGLNHNEAQWVAWAVLDSGRLESYSRPKDLVADLYSGKKAHLRPIHDALRSAGLAVGEDIRESVCRTYSSLATGRQFAMINPRTQRAVDLDLALPEGVDSPRLQPVKNSNPKFAHRIRVSSVEEVDDEVRRLLVIAADAAR